MDYQIGEVAVFIEHAVKLIDLDSKMEEATKVLVKETDKDPEFMACFLAKKSTKTALYLSGNTLDAEYIGRTGRTVSAEFKIVKAAWTLKEEITPDDKSIDLEEYMKIE